MCAESSLSPIVDLTLGTYVGLEACRLAPANRVPAPVLSSAVDPIILAFVSLWPALAP